MKIGYRIFTFGEVILIKARYYYAARGWRQDGASLMDISKLLRDADLSTTRKHYLYDEDDDIRKIVDNHKPGTHNE